MEAGPTSESYSDLLPLNQEDLEKYRAKWLNMIRNNIDREIGAKVGVFLKWKAFACD